MVQGLANVFIGILVGKLSKIIIFGLGLSIDAMLVVYMVNSPALG